MKKLAVSLILGASLVITPSVFALTKMTDSNMKSATAQAGVSIAVDNIKIESFTGSTYYTDEDGTLPAVSATGTAGSIVISNRHTLKSYNALPNGAAYGVLWQAATGTATVNTAAFNAMPLTIDVGACPLVSLANGLNDGSVVPVTTDAAACVTSLHAGAAASALSPTTAAYGVVIGLPTLMITTTSDTYSVGASLAGDEAHAKNFIKITKGASVMAILGGTIEIAAH